MSVSKSLAKVENLSAIVDLWYRLWNPKDMRWLIILTMATTAMAAKSPNGPFHDRKIACSPQFYALMGKLDIVKRWYDVEGKAGPRAVIMAETATPGVTLLVISRENATQIIREDDLKMTNYFFTAPDCGVDVAVTAKDTKLSDPFSDSDLEKLLDESRADGKPVLIYLWSPRMNLSMLGMDELADLAKRKNLNVVFVASPLSSPEELRFTCLQHHWPISRCRVATSQALIEKGAFVHFPSLIVIQKGDVSAPPFPGYDDPEQLKEYLESLHL